MNTFKKIYESSKDMIEGSAICDICGDAGVIGEDLYELPNGQHLCYNCGAFSEGDADYVDEEGYIRSQDEDEAEFDTMEEEQAQQDIWKAAGLDDDSLDDMGNIIDDEETDYRDFEEQAEDEDYYAMNDSLDDYIEEDEEEDEWD